MLGELSELRNPVPQVSSCLQVHHQVEVLSVLESCLHVDDEGKTYLRKYFPFVEDRVNASFVENSGFGHFLHSEKLLVFFALYLPNLSKSSFSNSVLVEKISFLNLNDNFSLMFCLKVC